MDNIHPIPLLSTINVRKRDVNKCIICETCGSRKQDKKLVSTPEGRQKIITSSNTLNDNILFGLTEDEFDSIQYQQCSCYAPYNLKAKRASKSNLDHTFEQPNETEPEPGPSRSRREVSVSPGLTTTNKISLKQCIICDSIKKKGDGNRYRVSENPRATKFIAAYMFNKDAVYKRCIFLKTPGDIFAADIVSHKNCMRWYIKTFETK